MQRAAAGTRHSWWLAFVALSAFPCASQPQWQLSSVSGDTLRIGFLAQARGEWLHTANPSNTAQNLFLRHLRLLAGAKLHHHLSIFLGMDSPNLGKAQPDGSKNASEVGVYDFWITYAPRQAAMVDVGLIGTPDSHNSIQSISGMLAADFGPYSFLANAPTASRAGRDYGVQTRGYLLGQHVEYRVGAFQGFRGPTAQHQLRYVGRIVVDAFRAEQSVYYAGTSLGTQRSLAVGGGFDHQEHYDAVGADLYADQPLPNGDAITLQLDWVDYNGGATFAQLPRQRATLLEAGYYLRWAKLSPFLQVARDDLVGTALTDQEQRLIGLGYWPNGHRLNIKAVYGSVAQGGRHIGSLAQLTFQCLEF